MRPEHNEIAAASKPCPRKIVFAERSGKPIQIISWGRPMTLRKNQANALSGTRRGMGSGITGQIRRNNVGKIRAAMLVAALAGESPAGGNCSVATVVISGSGASDQAAGSPEVKVSVG